jgi:hypothetical protein
LPERLSKTKEIFVVTASVPTEHVYPYTNLLGPRKERTDIRSVEEKRNRERKKDQENG